MTKVTVGSASTGTVPPEVSAASQAQANTGSVTGVYIEPVTLKNLDSDSVALVDAATIDLTGPKHTLATANGRTFTNSFVGDFIVLDITLGATSATFTFPAGYKCLVEGQDTTTATNTLAITGVVSGDVISVGILKNGASYKVASRNFGQ